MDLAKRNRLQTFLHSRTITERTLLLMYYADQLSPQEISLVLDLPLSEVVRRLASLISAARVSLAANDAARDRDDTDQPGIGAAETLVA